MSVFDKVKDVVEKTATNLNIDDELKSKVADAAKEKVAEATEDVIKNYILTDENKEKIKNIAYKLPLDKWKEIVPALSSLKDIAKKSDAKESLYRVTNLGKGDTLKKMKDGETLWGAIKKQDGTSAMAKLKEVKGGNVMAINPTSIMIAAAVASVEKDLDEIKDMTKKIVSFLEHDKESEIEADIATLNTITNEYKYNSTEYQYLYNNHKHVMDIKRTASKNMNFYKKQITDDLDKSKLLATNGTIDSMQKEIENKFKYYRLSLYIYSYASFLEVMLLGNFQEDYLMAKKGELRTLDNEYLENYNKAFEFVKKNANKSLQGNLLSGLGTAEKVIGSVAGKVKIKDNKVGSWLSEKGDNLKGIGQNMKDNFKDRFEDLSVSNVETFISKVEDVYNICNNTKAIYFDNENVYLTLGE